jgi:gas vesicle protein
MPAKTSKASAPQTPPDGTFFSGVVVGMVLGAGVYYLFGTEKGKKLKQELVEYGKEYLEEYAEYLPEKVVAEIQKIQVKPEVAKTLPEPKKPELPQPLNDIQKLELTVEEAARKAEEMETRLKKTASSIEKKFFFRKGRSLKK